MTYITIVYTNLFLEFDFVFLNFNIRNNMHDRSTTMCNDNDVEKILKFLINKNTVDHTLYQGIDAVSFIDLTIPYQTGSKYRQK